MKIDPKSKKAIAAGMFVRKDGVTAKELEKRVGWNDKNVAKFLYWVDLFSEAGAMSVSTETKSNGEIVYKIKHVGTGDDIPR